jgi:hypothetical protein
VKPHVECRGLVCVVIEGLQQDLSKMSVKVYIHGIKTGVKAER